MILRSYNFPQFTTQMIFVKVSLMIHSHKGKLGAVMVVVSMLVVSVCARGSLSILWHQTIWLELTLWYYRVLSKVIKAGWYHLSIWMSPCFKTYSLVRLVPSVINLFTLATIGIYRACQLAMSQQHEPWVNISLRLSAVEIGTTALTRIDNSTGGKDYVFRI